MGEIADSMINGEFCQSCGEYIGNATGYPRHCSGCKPKNNKKKKHVTVNNNIIAYNSLPKRP
ncbi:MAG: hypothetical protein UR43_C0019G0029 [candidate division TM6 bacterium GW2011_GWF2_33_332]|nr:MAG: hypothetical protein UR43_C0019G0029 [candidate division TM6 bacterium GW2011_GWF2_33_332]